MPHHIEVTTGLPPEDDAAMKQAVTAAVDEHLRLDALVNAAELHVFVSEFGVGQGGVAATALEISGTLNGKQLHQRFSSTRNAGSLVGGGVVGAVAAVAHAAASPLDGRSPQLVECFNECMADVKLAINRTIGRGESTTARRWKTYKLTGVVISLGVATASFFAGQQWLTAGNAAFVAVIHAALTWSFLYLLGLTCLPKRFLLDDARGQKIIARTGVQNVAAMRVMTSIFLVISGAALVIAVLAWLPD